MIGMLAAVMIASLVGSAHCAGMCGPLAVLAASGPTTTRGWARLMAGYHFGRLVGYALLGAVAGAAGAALDLGGDLLGVQQVAAMVAGGGMVLLGVTTLIQQRWGQAAFHLRVPKFIDRVMMAGHRRAQLLQPVSRSLAIGFLTILLPCGWLYAFLITAAGTARPWWGALVMVAFWVGTLPALTIITLGVRRLAGRWRDRIPLATAVLLIVVGAYTMLIRANVSYAALTANAATATSVDDEVARVSELPSQPMPCCHRD